MSYRSVKVWVEQDWSPGGDQDGEGTHYISLDRCDHCGALIGLGDQALHDQLHARINWIALQLGESIVT